MQALKSKLATLGVVGLLAFALLPAGLTVCGSAVSKLAHHGKRLHPVAHSKGPGFKATKQLARAIVSDVLPEENRELKNIQENYATARSVVRPQRDGSDAAWATRLDVTDRRSIVSLQSSLNL